MTNKELIKKLKENHGIIIELTDDINSLMNYVRHVSYGEGYEDGHSDSNNFNSKE